MTMTAEELRLQDGGSKDPEDLKTNIPDTGDPTDLDPDPENIPDPGTLPEDKKSETLSSDHGAGDPSKKDGEPAKADPQDALAEEVNELRQLLRQNKRDMSAQNQKMEEMEAKLRENNLLPEEDEEAKAAREAAEVAYAARITALETILETMKVNPKYEDVEQVVSQQHFDDVVEAMADVYAERNGGKASDYVEGITKWVWDKPNPYLFMYGQIKQFHPDYAAPASSDPAAKPAKDEKKPDEKKPDGEKRDPSVKDTMPSLMNIPGSDGTSGGWTSAKIDSMNELELGKVPKEIYKMYLQNRLP